MRITHVNLARGFRGGERQTLNLMEGLAALGVEQTLVCRTGAELKRRVAHLPVKIREIAHPLLGHLNPPGADIIHVHEARGAYWAAIEHMLRHTPYIITRRIPNPISDSAVTASVYRNADKLLGVSQYVARCLAQKTGLPVNAILSSTSTLPADPARVREIRERFGSGPIIGHVGALHDHHKGQSVLIQAFLRLVQDFPTAQLLLVGEGPDRAQFEVLANGDPRIHFVGFQNDIGSWTAAMDLFCFPSREEGLGSSVLDAMALKVPVIAAKVDGLPELIGNNERGLGVDGHEPAAWEGAMRRMLGDAAMRAQAVQAASSFSAENGIEAMTRSYLAVYEKVWSARHFGAGQAVGIPH
jgi:glycosyltransferase involved in cell wall biosynthesis